MFFDSRQLAFDFVSQVDEERATAGAAPQTHDDSHDEWASAPSIRRIVSAASVTREKCRAPASVFDLAHRPVTVKLEGHDRSAAIYRTSTHDGVTRCVSVREQDTAEWQEKEQARRARQRPPKPTKQRFKMRNSRVWADEPK
ncbi:hypothetical protein GN316_06605 [Xylophilus sp. Kf1]|nr:hypothetical protein [Xylophilus sp. Kf1]